MKAHKDVIYHKEQTIMAESSIEYHEPRRRRGLFQRILGLPVLYKVLLANSVIIFIGATGGTWLASNLHNSQQNVATPTSLVLFILAGLLVSVIINFVVLQIAFRPLIDLGKVMGRVQAGEHALRAPLTGLDPEADQLARTFNTMLEAIDNATRFRASQIIKAQEQERKRIARELHDETSQLLTSLLISLAVLEESVTTDDAHERVAETRKLAHQTLRAIRNLSIDLRPSALDDLGLLPAMRWYIKEYQQKCGITVDLRTSGFKERLPTEVETALYRIMQEALTNTARHAKARKVKVTMKEDSQAIHVLIRDDGEGFDVDSVMKNPYQDRGLGLVGMNERAVLLNGSLDITSEVGRGTTIKADIPFRAAETTENAIEEDAFTE